ncbi:MAG: TrkA family potassium uptake protein [Chloroflexi bacterium]|nr:TrkA family potassium uptake protein [Chloroflexota bacterium]
MAANVLIVGCGRLGAMVATALVDRGDHVTIIDTDAENFRRLAEQPGLSMIVADGTSNEDLRRAGVESADVFISLTAQDTVNALAAQAAQLTFGVSNVVCRINDPVRREMYEGLGLRTVSPSQVMTDLVLEAVER